VKYRTPPIEEALVELHFDEAVPDSAIGGRFYEGWKVNFARRDQIEVRHFQLKLGPGVVSNSPTSPIRLPTERLWLAAHPTIAVQVGPSILSVHFVRNCGRKEADEGSPYPGFEHLHPHVGTAISQYRSLVSPTSLRGVTVRYLNRLLVPLRHDGTAEDWLNVGVTLPGDLSGSLGRLAVDFVTDAGPRGTELVYSMRASLPKDGNLEVWLDLQVRALPAAVPSFDELDLWLSRAHDEGIIKMFEGSITDRAREAFGVNDDPQ
jgi:uncharacterized protein (TIGR04255 family)